MAITKIQSESLNLADDYAFTGTITGAGGNNKPYFQAKMSSADNLSNNVVTKVNYDNELIDTDSYYDTSNKRFTPQVAGKYMIYAQAFLSSNTVDNLYKGELYIYKNGSAFTKSDSIFANNLPDSVGFTVQGIIDLNGSTDYVEIYANIQTSNGSGNTIYQTQNRCIFFGYKLID